MKKEQPDGSGRRNDKAPVRRRLAQVKAKLGLLERKIQDGIPVQKLKEDLEKSKVLLSKMKEKFRDYEEKTVRYIGKNPKKALAMATAAGAMVGALWGSFHGDRKKKR